MRNHWFGGIAAGFTLALIVVAGGAGRRPGPRGRRRTGCEAGSATGGPSSATAQRANQSGRGARDRRGSGTRSTDSWWARPATRCPTNLEIAEVPFRPWAKALYEYRDFRDGLDDPHARCQPAGGLRFLTAPNGTEFIQDPEHDRIIMIDGENRDWKRIAMEPGRKHPSTDDLNPSYFGDAIGHWEGDTLVVDTVGFNEKFWAFRNGMPHTRFLHLTERYTRVDMNRIKYEVTIDDKGAYTRPFSGGWYINWQSTNYDNTPNGEIHEYFCIDNERDSQHLER